MGQKYASHKKKHLPTYVPTYLSTYLPYIQEAQTGTVISFRRLNTKYGSQLSDLEFHLWPGPAMGGFQFWEHYNVQWTIMSSCKKISQGVKEILSGHNFMLGTNVFL